MENHWVNPKTDLVDPHRTKNEQNTPSCTVYSNFLCLNSKIRDTFWLVIGKDVVGMKKMLYKEFAASSGSIAS